MKMKFYGSVVKLFIILRGSSPCKIMKVIFTHQNHPSLQNHGTMQKVVEHFQSNLSSSQPTACRLHSGSYGVVFTTQ
jgi:hypothetical protein